jgi:hypothetical protein
MALSKSDLADIGNTPVVDLSSCLSAQAKSVGIKLFAKVRFCLIL